MIYSPTLGKACSLYRGEEKSRECAMRGQEKVNCLVMSLRIASLLWSRIVLDSHADPPSSLLPPSPFIPFIGHALKKPATFASLPFPSLPSCLHFPSLLFPFLCHRCAFLLCFLGFPLFFFFFSLPFPPFSLLFPSMSLFQVCLTTIISGNLLATFQRFLLLSPVLRIQLVTGLFVFP